MNRVNLLGGLLLAASLALLVLPQPAAAQVPPPPGTPPAQVQQQIDALGLRSQVLARIRSSGMTPDQIRSRLSAMGYDPTTLDAYLSDDPTPPPAPSSSALAAIRSLGLANLPDSAAAEPARPAPAPLTPQEERLDLRVFGVEVFSSATSQFDPVAAAAVPSDYVLGPGDELVLVITGDVEYVHTLPVTREGFILIPQVGQVWVNGLTVEGLRDQLYTRLGQVYSGISRGAGASTHFDISLARVRTNQVYISGEVVRPGAYTVSPLASVLNALYQAGGPTGNGSFREVHVLRGGRIAQRVDLYDFLLRGDNLDRVRLEPGDVIFVPVHGPHVALRGEVVRPAIYELQPGETLAHLIAAAGGTTAPASLRRARITRVLPAEQRTTPGVDRTTVDVSLADALRDPEGAPRLGDGDEVRVFAIRGEVRNTVSLSGSVWQGGTFAFQPGMRAWDLIELANGLSPDAYLQRATITRLNLADSTLSMIPFSLERSDNGSGPRDNPPLQEFDVVDVFSQASATQRLPVNIQGEVHNPAEAEFKEGMTLRDLIVAAGGLRPTADLTIQVTRIPAGSARENGEIAQQFKIAADSSYFVSDQSARYYFGDRATLERSVGGGEAAAFQLMPYDRVVVRRIPEFELHRSVHIAGEVAYPGSYSLLRKDERLRSFVVERAGGVTQTGFAEGFQFFRNGARVDIDLGRVLANPGSGENIILLPGDSMFVPEYNPVVLVQGAVNSPGAVLYQPGRSLEYYIESAGGYTRDADQKRVQVRYANGEGRVRKRSVFFRSDPKPGPGSVVTVTQVRPEDKTDVRGMIADIAQVVAALGTILVVALR